MATVKWRGDAPTVAQVATVQVTAYDAATTYKLTINGKTVSVIAQGSVNATASGLATAWNASTIAEVAEITAAAATDTVTLTADTSGKPFTCTSSVSGGTGTIGAVTTTTASNGPNDLGIAANYSGGSLPTNGDDLVFEASASDVLYNLGALAAVILNSLTIKASYTGKVGLPEVAATGYQEYRATYLAAGATTITIGQGNGSKSGRLKLNTGSVQTLLNVHDTGTPVESTLEALLWKGTHPNNVVNILAGSVGIAAFAGETATVATLNVGGGQVRCYPGCTLTTITQTGGTVEFSGNVTTYNLKGGQANVLQSSPAPTLGTVAGTGGTMNLMSGATITTLNLYGAVLDCSKDPRAKTVSNCDVWAGATIRDPQKSVTWTNGIDVNGCGLKDLREIDIGQHFRLTVGEVA